MSHQKQLFFSYLKALPVVVECGRGLTMTHMQGLLLQWLAGIWFLGAVYLSRARIWTLLKVRAVLQGVLQRVRQITSQIQWSLVLQELPATASLPTPTATRQSSCVAGAPSLRY